MHAHAHDSEVSPASILALTEPILEFKAKTLRDLPEESLFRELDLAAALAVPEIRRAFLKAVRAAIDGTRRSQFEAAIYYGDITYALESVPWNKLDEMLSEAFGADSKLVDAYLRGSRIGQKLLPKNAAVDFDDVSPQAVAYIETHGARLVKEVTEETRQGLRKLLTAAYKTPRSIAETARDIRSILTARQANGLIGLTTKQGVALGKKIAAWVEDPDLSAKRIQQLIDREYRKQLKRRADLIAHTEAYNAGNEGLLESWREMERDGDIRVVGLNSYFVSDLGERLKRPGAHPRCFCVTRLRRYEKSREVYVREWVARVVGVCKRCKAFDKKLALP